MLSLLLAFAMPGAHAPQPPGMFHQVFHQGDHYNLSRPALFLSGAAEGDEPLHAVAVHNAVGC